MPVRFAVVCLILAAIAVSPLLYRRRRERDRRGPAVHAVVPSALVAGAARTWVLFTTPWCASCGPVEQQLRRFDPDARLVKVDATQEPGLVSALAVRSAPTALLADSAGRVQARLVGLAAVDDYVLAAR